MKLVSLHNLIGFHEFLAQVIVEVFEVKGLWCQTELNGQLSTAFYQGNENVFITCWRIELNEAKCNLFSNQLVCQLACLL